MNYVASVVFAALATSLLFLFAWNEHNVLAMKLCVYVAGAAWLACFTGYTAENLPHEYWISWISIATSVAAVAMFVWALAILRS